MGTRHVTMLIDKVGDKKVAQYGQWDGYPSGQGITILSFLKRNKLEEIHERFKKLRFETDEDEKAVKDFMEEIGCADGWMNSDQSDLFKRRFPQLSRDNGAGVLQMIMDDPSIDFLRDSEDFIADGLFCEWAYVIDLEKNVLEVYEGFNQDPLPDDNRFKDLKSSEDDDDDKYLPPMMVKSFDLDKLPGESEFLEILEPQEEEEEEI